MKLSSHVAAKRARIEIIPLIDIIFFLLATFVMVSTSMIKNLGIPVHLPVAATGAQQDREDHASITVTETGEIYFNKELLTDAQLPERLRQYKAERPDPKIFINGDEKAMLGKAISVLDEIRKLNITRVAIETRPAKAPARSAP